MARSGVSGARSGGGCGVDGDAAAHRAGGAGADGLIELSGGVSCGMPGGADGATAAEEAVMSAAELAEMIDAFSGVAARLQQTQQTLRGEVQRLERELSDSRRALKRAEELAAIGEMAAGIAHEIRNPLGSMKLYARLLMNDLSDRPSERATAEKIERGVDRVNEIITDVLALARDVRVDPKRHGARWVVESGVACCRGGLDSAGVRVLVDESVDGAGAIRCDGSLMRQVLANIIENACQAIGEWADRPSDAGLIEIRHERRGVLGADGKRRSMDALIVADDGPGIAEEAIDRAFNPFYTTRAAGTGLGLAIVHRVMDAHGGLARLERGAGGRGTTVELLLPAEGGVEREAALLDRSGDWLCESVGGAGGPHGEDACGVPRDGASS